LLLSSLTNILHYYFFKSPHGGLFLLTCTFFVQCKDIIYTSILYTIQDYLRYNITMFSREYLVLNINQLNQTERMSNE